jgi:hypothetical protein
MPTTHERTQPFTPYAIALIVGTVGGLVTMGIHPTRLSWQDAELLKHELQVAIAVHVLALFSVPLTFFGLVGVWKRIGWQRPAAQFAILVYGLSAVAVMIAAICDGLVAPALIQKTIGATEAATGAIRSTLVYNFQLNQAAAKVFVVGSSISMIVWSYAISRLGRLEHGLAVLGWIVGALAMLGIFSGHVGMSAHGFGLIVLLQAFWNIGVAVALIRSDRARRTPADAPAANAPEGKESTRD